MLPTERQRETGACVTYSVTCARAEVRVMYSGGSEMKPPNSEKVGGALKNELVLKDAGGSLRQRKAFAKKEGKWKIKER